MKNKIEETTLVDSPADGNDKEGIMREDGWRYGDEAVNEQYLATREEEDF